MSSYLETKSKYDCCGCGACSNVCPKVCINMQYDTEGFLYPVIDESLCINCKKCVKVCPFERQVPNEYSMSTNQKAYGGYIKDPEIRAKSTSGGAFTAIVNAYCDENYAVFGAEMDYDFNVHHSCVYDKNDIDKFRGSKYIQSEIRDSYIAAKKSLDKGRKVLFTGTPCQIAGLYSYLHGDREGLVTIDLVCHGVPSRKWFDKEKNYLEKKYHSALIGVQFRNKDNGHWDNGDIIWLFENKKRKKFRDEPYKSAWLGGMTMRPSCTKCPYANLSRVGDITLADLWGVHKFAPEIYGGNMGTSFIACNTSKGEALFEKVKSAMIYQQIDIHEAAKYNHCLNEPTPCNEKRDAFMSDIDRLDFDKICKKYLKKESIAMWAVKKYCGRQLKTKMWKLYTMIRGKR